MSTTPRKFQGVWIPAEVWLDRGLSITEKVMLVEIGSLQDAGGKTLAGLVRRRAAERALFEAKP